MLGCYGTTPEEWMSTKATPRAEVQALVAALAEALDNYTAWLIERGTAASGR